VVDKVTAADQSAGSILHVMPSLLERSFPFAPVIHRLSNGIPVLVDTVPTVGSCSVGIWVRAGTRDEPARKAGIAHFVEHTSFRRTANRTTARIARDFEHVGAYANAFTTKEETCYEVRALAESFEAVTATLADVVTHPLFREDDIERERSIITEEIRSYEDEAEEHVFDIGEAQLFAGHSLATPIVGTVESVQSIEAAHVRTFHQRLYNANNMVLAVSGNVDPQHVVRVAERHLGAVARGRAPLRKPPSPVTPSHVVHQRPLQQAHLLWQVRTPGQFWHDRYALQVLSTILGDGMASRLNVRIRESRGLAYTVYSSFQLFTDCGSFAIYAGLEESRLAKAETLIHRELEELRANGIRPAELHRAKQQLRAAKIMSLESLSTRMSMLGKTWLEEGAPEDPFETIRCVEAVTVQDVHRVAVLLCNPNDWSRCTMVPLSTGEA
jgi:predicted Zn-dependent peptidase